MAVTAMSKSLAFASYIQQKGYKMPKSPTTISKCINSFYKEKCTELRENFEKLKMQSVNLQLHRTNGQIALFYGMYT